MYNNILIYHPLNKSPPTKILVTLTVNFFHFFLFVKLTHIHNYTATHAINPSFKMSLEKKYT